GILSLIWLLPFVTGLVLIAAVPGSNIKAVKWAALLSSGASLLLTAWLCFRFDYSKSGEWQFHERFSLVSDLHINYHVAVDGMSLVMGVLNAVILFTGVLASWGVKYRVK